MTRTQMANQDNHEFRSAELLLRSQVQSAPITRVAFPQSDSLLKILALRLRLLLCTTITIWPFSSTIRCVKRKRRSVLLLLKTCPLRPPRLSLRLRRTHSTSAAASFSSHSSTHTRSSSRTTAVSLPRAENNSNSSSRTARQSSNPSCVYVLPRVLRAPAPVRTLGPHVRRQ